jgi:hypothetical protein
LRRSTAAASTAIVSAARKPSVTTRAIRSALAASSSDRAARWRSSIASISSIARRIESLTALAAARDSAALGGDLPRVAAHPDRDLERVEPAVHQRGEAPHALLLARVVEREPLERGEPRRVVAMRAPANACAWSATPVSRYPRALRSASLIAE